MQSIAPEVVEIIVTGEGVEIGGKKRAVGWHGEVKRASARSLLAAGKAKMYAPPAPVLTPIAEEPAVGQTSPEPDVEPEAEATVAEGNTKRVPRNGRS